MVAAMKLSIEVSTHDEARAGIEVLMRYMAMVEPSIVQPESLPLSELGLLVRTQNCLLSADICTVDQLINCTWSKLMRLPNFGRRSLDDVRARLASMGLALRDERRVA